MSVDNVFVEETTKEMVGLIKQWKKQGALEELEKIVELSNKYLSREFAISYAKQRLKELKELEGKEK